MLDGFREAHMNSQVHVQVHFSQVVVNNSCSELWEVHGFCYKFINTGAHCLLCSISKRRQNRY